METTILELVISESIKDMFLHEGDEDLRLALADLQTKSSDFFFEKFTPYFEHNLLLYDNLLSESVFTVPLKNAKQNIENYKKFLKEKINLNINKAKQFTKNNLSNIKNTILAGIAKRLDYASQNLKKGSDILKKKGGVYK
jgi:hypothetical protein